MAVFLLCLHDSTCVDWLLGHLPDRHAVLIVADSGCCRSGAFRPLGMDVSRVER
jgi:hypothetical protein